MSTNWQIVQALRNEPALLADVESVFAEQALQDAEREAIAIEGKGSVRGEVPHLIHTPTDNSSLSAVFGTPPQIPFSEIAREQPSTSTLSAGRRAELKAKYHNKGLPELSDEGLDPNLREQSEALAKANLITKAKRLKLCRRLSSVWECTFCGGAYRVHWYCGLRSCPGCGRVNYDRAFARLLRLDSMIPSAIRTQPGYGWKILDFTFAHEGKFASRESLQEMRRVVLRTVKRAVREKQRKEYLTGICCRLKLDDAGHPMMSEGWPIGIVQKGPAKGEERLLRGWGVVSTGRKELAATCILCGTRVRARGQGRRQKGQSAEYWCKHCEKKLDWWGYRKEEINTYRWRLRLGWIYIAVSEFGYNQETGSPNFNYHFHGAFFGPYLPNNPKGVHTACGQPAYKLPELKSWSCKHCGRTDIPDGDVGNRKDGRLTEIFREESAKALGRESRGTLVQAGDFQSVLAHALKYTRKIPASTPQGRAQYEILLNGVRRFAVSGLLQGVPLPRPEEKHDCLNCRMPLTKTLRMVPTFEVADLAVLPGSDQGQSAPSGASLNLGIAHQPQVTCGQVCERAP